jgi:hypothetical protein
MANNPNENEVVAPDISWIVDEPLESVSSFASDGTTEIPFSSVRRSDDWEVVLPSVSDRVCSPYAENTFPMYLKDGGRAPVVVGVVPVRVPYFPLCWCNDHYNCESKDFGRSYVRLTE